MRFNQLRRREFISSLAGALVWPFAARTQQAERMRRIDVLMAYAESDPEGAREIVELRPDLVLTQNTPTTAAMLQLTRSLLH